MEDAHTTITDLHSDCIEIILGYLEFDDLLNIANSSKQFYDAVCMAYKRKYANKELVFHRKAFRTVTRTWSFLVNCSVWDEDELDMFIFIRTPLGVLRNFGHMVKKLRISFHNLNTELCAEIENYLARYCSASLEVLHIACNTSKVTFKDLPKPLENVRCLRIKMVTGQTLEDLRFLNENNLPIVKNIRIDYMDQSMQALRKTHYENIEYFMVRCRLSEYPFSFGNLKCLTIAGNSQVNDALCQCIGNIRHLKVLKIWNTWLHFNSDSFYKILKLQNILSNLEEMQFELFCNTSLDDVLRFLEQSRRLRKLSILIETIGRVRRFYSHFLQTIATNLDEKQWTHHTKKLSNEPGLGYFIDLCLLIERVNSFHTD